MPKQQRVFSKIIHIKAIDRVSTLIGLSVARPNALLLGALGSFTVAFTVYTLSKSHGYAISGLEPIIGFTAGWLAGTLYDTIKPLVTKIAAVLR